MKLSGIYIKDLPLSRELKKECAAHGFTTLGEILNIPVEMTYQMPWLTESMISELQGIVSSLKEIESRSDNHRGA